MNAVAADTSIQAVTVVLVTYGDRWHLLKEVLSRLVSDPFVADCVVVDNGSKYSVATSVKKADWGSKVSVVTESTNLGSAQGYANGIAHAIANTSASWLYLLDDDNRPTEGAIGSLLQLIPSEPDGTCFLSLRNDRPEQQSSLKTNTPIRQVPNSFSGFHFLGALSRRFASRGSVGADFASDQVEVDFAPYGGLLFHRSWIERIGLPNGNYFVYADDHEFTNRIVSAGGRILLSGKSCVEDLETSWHLKPSARSAGLLSSESPDFRLYYSIRNRVDYEHRRLVTSKASYFMNLFIFLSLRYWRAAIADRSLIKPATKLIVAVNAFRDGWSGRLGRNSEY